MTIRKTKTGYVLKSKTTGRTLGKSKTKAGILKREKQINYFKNKAKQLENKYYKKKGFFYVHESSVSDSGITLVTTRKFDLLTFNIIKWLHGEEGIDKIAERNIKKDEGYLKNGL